MIIILKVIAMGVLTLVALLVGGTGIIFVSAFFYRLIKTLFAEEFNNEEDD